MTLAGMWAAAGGDGATDVTSLINLGAVGVIAAILIAFARGAYQDVKTQRDNALAEAARQRDLGAAEVARLNSLIQDKVIDAITGVTRAVEAITRTVEDSKQQLLAIAADRQQLRLELEELRIRTEPRPRRRSDGKDDPE